MLKRVGPLLVAMVGGAMASGAMPEVDRTRAPRAVDEALVFVPDGRTVRIAATGQEEPLSNIFWVRAVLIFGERWDGGQAGEWTDRKSVV